MQNDNVGVVDLVIATLVLVIGLASRHLLKPAQPARDDTYSEVLRDLLDDKRRLKIEVMQLESKLDELERENG